MEYLKAFIYLHSRQDTLEKILEISFPSCNKFRPTVIQNCTPKIIQLESINLRHPNCEESQCPLLLTWFDFNPSMDK